jgi:hypothetical protein
MKGRLCDTGAFPLADHVVGSAVADLTGGMDQLVIAGGTNSGSTSGTAP